MVVVYILTIYLIDLYSAGMVIVLSKSCLPMQDHFDEKVVERAWIECCSTLQLLTQYGKAAELGLSSLRAMYDRLVIADTTGKRCPSFFTLFISCFLLVL